MKLWMVGVTLAVIALSACNKTREIVLAPVSTLSPEAQKSPIKVRESYQFALANPDLLEQFPCYCGCGSMGHTSNLDCYVKEFNADGSVTFDHHALG